MDKDNKSNNKSRTEGKKHESYAAAVLSSMKTPVKTEPDAKTTSVKATAAVTPPTKKA